MIPELKTVHKVIEKAAILSVAFMGFGFILHLTTFGGTSGTDSVHQDT